MLLHVLAQVGLLGVGLAAVRADVRLQVLALAVLGNVLEKSRLFREALVAAVALEGLVRLMGAAVRLKIGKLTEGFGAGRPATAVRLVARVRPQVLLQVGELGELALAELTAVRLDAQVDARVLREVGGVGEAFCALRALVGLCLAHVHLRVQLHVGF